MAQPGGGSDGELSGIVETLVKERTYAVELKVRDQRIPIGHRSPPACPGIQVMAGKTARVGQQSGSRNIRVRDHAVGSLLRVRGFAVEEQLRVELTRAPTFEHFTNVIHGDTRILGGKFQQLDKGLQVRRRGNDGAQIEITIRQAIDPLAYPGRDGVIHSRMTHGASKSDRAQRIVVEEADHAENGILLDKLQRYCGIVEIYHASLDRRDHGGRKSIGVDLQAKQ